MKPPFSPDQFFGLFEQYHTAVFPSQWIILLLGIVSLLFLHFPRNYANHFIGLVLAFLWIWAGSAYFLAQFATLSKAGFLFGGLFILQGLLTGYFAFRKDRLSFSFHGLKREYAGYALILFGLFLYPVIAYCLEGSLSRTISLGLPCPTTIVTFGFFMLTSSRFPRILLIIPTIWALIGMNAAIHFGVIQDYMMVIAAIGANILLLGKRTHRP